MATYNRVKRSSLRVVLTQEQYGNTDVNENSYPKNSREVEFYSSLVKGDKIRPNNYDFFKLDHVPPKGMLGRVYVDERQGWDKRTVRTESFGVIGSIGGFHRVHEDESRQRAISKLYDSIRGGLDLSVGIGEHASTTKMLRAAASFGKFIVKFHPKRWANNWLEYTYGWKPLMNDLYSAVNEVNHIAEDFKIFSEKATVKHEEIYRSEGDYITVDTQLQSNRTKYTVLLSPANSTISTVARFTSLNPASIAWELTPMSFVFDWFIDIGGYMRDLETSLAYSGAFRSGYCTTTSKIWLERDVVGSGQSGDVTTYGHVNGYREQRTLNRSIMTGLPMPSLPRFKPQLGASRLVSAAALLKVLFLKPKAPPRIIRRSQDEIQRRLEMMARGPRKWPKDRIYRR